MIRRIKRWDAHAAITHGDSLLHVLLSIGTRPRPPSIELQPDRFDDRRPPRNIVFDESSEFIGC